MTSMESCRLCFNEDGNTKVEAKEMMFGIRDSFAYMQCGNCRCLQLIDVPADMGEYYPADYYSLNGSSAEKSPLQHGIALARDYLTFNVPALRRALLRNFESSVLDQFESVSRCPNVSKESSILDVGCGGGRLLKSLRRAGFKSLLGVDPFLSEDTVESSGLSMQKKTIFETEGEYNLIMFHHVLEHLEGQKEVLSKCHSILSDDGVVLIRIPTVDSRVWREYRECWVELDAPRHLFLHSEQSFEMIAAECGFVVDSKYRDSRSFQYTISEFYKNNISMKESETKTTFVKKWLKEKRYRQQSRIDNKNQSGGRVVYCLRKSTA